MSRHRTAAPARTHEQRASTTGWPHNYLGILLIDRFNFGIKWIAVEQPCRQLSTKRSKPSQFIFIRVQEPVSKKSRNRPCSASPNQAQQGRVPVNSRAKTKRPPERRRFPLQEDTNLVSRSLPQLTASEAKESPQPSLDTQVL